MMLKRWIGPVLLGLLVCGWTITQWVAHRLGYHPSLGRPWLRQEGIALYSPWSVVGWYWAWGGRYSRIFLQAASVPVLAIAGGVALWARLKQKPQVQQVGTDGWGDQKDLKRAGLLNRRGTVVGRWGRHVLMYDGPEHQLVAGASRSGKTVGHVIPTLLSWPESTLVYDIKGELWEVTAGFRSRFSHAAYFNPVKPESVKFNPLLEVRTGPTEIRDVQNIVEVLVNPSGNKNDLDVWDQNASQFLVALILHVVLSEPPEQKNLGRVRDLLLDFDTTCRAMTSTRHRVHPDTGDRQPHPECQKVAQNLLNQAERFRSSVRGTAESYLTLFADPLVRQNTSKSDFTIGDLTCAPHPLSLYLQVPPSDADRLRPLVRLLLSQFARGLMEDLDHDNRGRKKRHRLLLVVDEFPTLKKLDFFQTNLRQMASYKLKALLIVQSFQDLADGYGPYNSIIDNCHVVTAFAAADTNTQQRVSQMTGSVLEYREGYSRPLGLPRGRSTVSYSEQVRPLLPPAKVRELPADEQLVFVNGFPPFRTQKVRYFDDPVFRGRVVPPPDQGRAIDLPAPDNLAPAPGISTVSGNTPGIPPTPQATSQEPTSQEPSRDPFLI